MALPPAVLEFLDDDARRAGVANPAENDDLFKLGILDSFSLVDFLAVLEEHCRIKVPDSEVTTEDFRTIEEIERFAGDHRGP